MPAPLRVGLLCVRAPRVQIRHHDHAELKQVQLLAFLLAQTLLNPTLAPLPPVLRQVTAVDSPQRGPLGVLIGRPQGSAMAPQALPPGTMEVQVGQVPRLVVMGRPRLTTTEVCPCNLGIASRGKLSTATPWCHGHARGHTTCRTALSR